MSQLPSSHPSPAAVHHSGVPSAASAGQSAAETPRPPSHNGSTSSSAATTPRSTSIEPGPTLWVEMWESQRWFPVIGWSTSRLLRDLPTFCRVPPSCRRCGAHPETFDAALNAANPPPADAANPHFPAQPMMELRVPGGYRWVGYWEICRQHRHGTDVNGWRYAEQYFRGDGAAGYRLESLAPFKKTQTSLCVVRRRLWRRRVAVLTSSEAAPSHSEDSYMTEEDLQTQSYLADMDEEMKVAERFKAAEAQAAQAGTPWTRDQELKAEEELRKFCRQRRSRESATRMRSANPSFANPFHHSSEGFHFSPASHDADAGEPLPAAPPTQQQTYTADDALSPSAEAQQDDAFLFRATSTNTPSRVDGSDLGTQSRVNRFVAASPTEPPLMMPDAGDLTAQKTVDEFVTSTPVDQFEPEPAPEDPAMVSVGGIKSPTGAEFRAIFSQFMTPLTEKTTEEREKEA